MPDKMKIYEVTYGNGGRQKCKGKLELGRFLAALVAEAEMVHVTVRLLR